MILGALTSIMDEDENPIRRLRLARGISQSELAKRAGISRQALGSIESGVYQPGVNVALALARELGESVEALFVEGETFQRVDASWAAAESETDARGGHVALARVAGKVVAHPQPAVRIALAPSAGILERADRRRARVSSFRSQQEIDATLLVAGCDPAAVLLADWLARRRSPVTAVALSCSSAKALSALLIGRAHAAGVHLRDRHGDFNLAAVRRALGHRRSMLVNFARWELGLATAAGNPLKIRGFADLERARLRIANRDRGSGARSALDEAIAEAGIPAGHIRGYQHELPGHLEVAAAIAGGQADVGVTLRVAAQAHGLGFVELREERYDLVILERDLESTPIKELLYALSSRRFAREVSELCAYDTSQMGKVIARIN